MKRVHFAPLYIACAATCWAIAWVSGVRNGTVASLVVGYGGGLVLTVVAVLLLRWRGWRVPSVGRFVWSQVMWMLIGYIEPRSGSQTQDRAASAEGSESVTEEESRGWSGDYSLLDWILFPGQVVMSHYLFRGIRLPKWRALWWVLRAVAYLLAFQFAVPAALGIHDPKRTLPEAIAFGIFAASAHPLVKRRLGRRRETVKNAP